MMNYIWSGMIIAGLLFSCFNGSYSAFVTGIMDSANEAVTFAISLAGIMALWSGLMEIAERSGLIDNISRASMPLIHFLFPGEREKETISLMMMSFTANIFGAGNSATVFSLKAMERLNLENRRSPLASNTMCMFTALSMSMIQLVPVNILQIRYSHGSSNPEAIIIPSILAGLISIFVSVAVCKMCEKRSSCY